MAKKLTIIDAEEARQVLTYDPDTGVFTWREGCHGRVKPGSVAGVTHKTRRYVRVGVKGAVIYGHRLAWIMHYGVEPSGVIDHINGIKDDNRIANLRDVDHATNSQNVRTAPKRSKSGLLGAHYKPKLGYYSSKIREGHRVITIGYFKTAEEAHAAYLARKRVIHSGCTI